MVPSLKFTMIAWLAIIGFGLLSLGLKYKKNIAGIHLTNTPKLFAVQKPTTLYDCFSFSSADKLITGEHQESKNLQFYILTNQVDYWNRVSWNDQFSRATYSHRQHQYAGWLNAQWYTPRNVVNDSGAFVGSDEGNAMTGSK